MISRVSVLCVRQVKELINLVMHFIEDSQPLSKRLPLSPVVFRREFLHLGFDTKTSLLLSQFLYWQEHINSKDGWFWKTQKSLMKELGINYKEQKRIREKLIALSLLEEEKRGLPSQLWYRLNLVNLSKLLKDNGLDGCESYKDQKRENKFYSGSKERGHNLSYNLKKSSKSNFYW